jgi:hypothetical protein
MVDLTHLKRKKYGGVLRRSRRFLMAAEAQVERKATMRRILPRLGATTYYGH